MGIDFRTKIKERIQGGATNTKGFLIAIWKPNTTETVLEASVLSGESCSISRWEELEECRIGKLWSACIV